MAIQIKHAFTSAKGDGTDATLVRPSNWNALHTTSMATGNLLGRQTAGAGVFEEIPLSAFMAGILNSADANAFLAALGIGAFTTGDMKFSIDATQQAGWIVYNLNTASGTIGDASSVATVRANADCSALFQMIWNNIADADCPVPGGRGASALIDWNNHKQIQLPWVPGRAIIGNAGGAALPTRVIGRVYGNETYQLVTSNLPPYTPAGSVSVTGGVATIGTASTAAAIGSGGGNQLYTAIASNGFTTIPLSSISGSFTGSAQGGSSVAIDMKQPSISLWAKVKL